MPVSGASVYGNFNILHCAVIGQICCICVTVTSRTCPEESCRDSPALSSASRKQTCLSLLFVFYYTFRSLSDFRFMLEITILLPV